MALPKKLRLTRKKDIDHLFKYGKTVKGSFFFIKFLKNNLAYGRALVVVSRKIAKRAVDRNSIRRRIIHMIHGTHFVADGFDSALVLTAPMPKQSLEVIKQELLAFTFK